MPAIEPIHDRTTVERMQQMLQTMLTLQEQHNVLVAADWRTRGLAFCRAIWVECAELLDHYGWKWWKHQNPDIGQVRLEIVDIWHFGLSCLMLRGDENYADVVQAFAAQRTETPRADADEVFREHVERLASSALAGDFSVPHFVAVMASLPMSFDELFELYVGKNVLNRFRQRNGYADGSYRKLWAGREDNVHLIEVIATLASNRSDYIDALHTALDQRYRAAIHTGSTPEERSQ